MIRLLYDTTIGGIRHGKGSVINLDPVTERDLLANGNADRGTGVFSRDESGNIVGLEGDEGSTISLALSYKWNTRPNAFTTAAGTIIRISDVGGAAGSLWSATAEGWVPLNGRVLIAQAYGSVAAPLATQTGSAGTAFTVPGGNVFVPARMLIVGKSALLVEALCRKRGANGTAVFTITFGTANTASDSAIVNMAAAAATNQDLRPFNRNMFPTSTTMTATGMLYAGANNGSAVITDRTTNINTNADMYIGFNINGANTADAFDLIGYSVAMESL